MKTVPVIPTARAAWPRWWPAGLAWALWTLTLLGLAVTVWLDRLLMEAGLPELATVVEPRQPHLGGSGGERGHGRAAGGQPPPPPPGGAGCWSPSGCP